jgi:hypothetical protein
MATHPVHDLAIHPREEEIIVGTHERGISIADISGLQALTRDALAADAVLAPIVPTVQTPRRDGFSEGPGVVGLALKAWPLL